MYIFGAFPQGRLRFFLMIIETFKTNKTIKMATDNAVIPDLVMVLTVLMVLIVLRYNRKRLNPPP